MKNDLTQWYVATVWSPSSSDGVYRGWTPCMDWCRNTFGDAPTANLSVGHGWRYITEGVFEFERETDRTAFLLRWA